MTANRPSYPYLDVARKYNVPYRDVLRFVDWLDHTIGDVIMDQKDWHQAANDAFVNEMEHRRASTGA